MNNLIIPQHIQDYVIFHGFQFKAEFEENYQNRLDNHQPPASGDGIFISGFLTCVSGSTFADLNGRFFLLRSLSQIRFFFRSEYSSKVITYLGISFHLLSNFRNIQDVRIRVKIPILIPDSFTLFSQ